MEDEIKNKNCGEEIDIKARIITGTLVLQMDRHRFNEFDISSICPMCRLEDEDIIHFLLKCPLLAGSRQEPFRQLKNEVINNSEDGIFGSVALVRRSISPKVR
jgi:hypothetical protein